MQEPVTSMCKSVLLSSQQQAINRIMTSCRWQARLWQHALLRHTDYSHTVRR